MKSRRNAPRRHDLLPGVVVTVLAFVCLAGAAAGDEGRRISVTGQGSKVTLVIDGRVVTDLPPLIVEAPRPVATRARRPPRRGGVLVIPHSNASRWPIGEGGGPEKVLAGHRRAMKTDTTPKLVGIPLAAVGCPCP